MKTGLEIYKEIREVSDELDEVNKALELLYGEGFTRPQIILREHKEKLMQTLSQLHNVEYEENMYDINSMYPNKYNEELSEVIEDLKKSEESVTKKDNN